MLRRAAVVVVALLMPALAWADEASALVDKVVAAYGGRQKLAAIRSLHETGTISSLRTGQTGSVERWLVMPDRLRMDMHYPNGEAESRILDRTQAYKNGILAQGPLLAATKLQAARFRLPLLLTERPVKLGGMSPEGWTVLAADLGGGMAVEAQIDTATAQIRRSRGLMDMGGQAMEFVTDYDDFRNVDGVLVAYREAHGAMGMATGETRLDKVEINPALTDAVFKP